MKFSENSNNFHELVCLTRSMSHPARLDGSQCYNYIFRHCKRLVLRPILARLIKSTLTRFKPLKTSNTRLNVYIIKSYTDFVCLSMYHMPGCIARQLVTARQLDSFLCIKSKAFTRLFFCSINKSGIIPLFYILARLYSLFSLSRRPIIRRMPNSGI